jgi:hypothetical protein
LSATAVFHYWSILKQDRKLRFEANRTTLR